MSKSVAVLLCVVVGTVEAAAQPVKSGGAEIAWSAPKEGALLEVQNGTEKAISLGGPRQLPSHGWLVARVRAGDLAWVHVDGDPEGNAVRFAFITGGVEGAAAVDAIPERRGPRDFVFRSPIGPQTRLGLRAVGGRANPRAQIWVGAVQSPGFRWELWEEKAKSWAAHLQGPPPPPPDLVGEPLVDRLALLADAIQLAQAESQPAPQAAAALLTAEALLANQLSREPLFPYFRRYELTRALSGGRPVQKIEDQRMFAASGDEPLRFTVDGPGFLRIEARARFAGQAPHGAVPLQLQLHANGRLLAVGAEEVLSKDPTEPGPGPISSRRRIVVVAAPGRHTYELQLRGGPAWLGIIMHTRVTHAEDLASHGEDIAWLLRRAGTASGLVGELLAGEASFLALDDERARAAFTRVATVAHNPRLHAFALLRLAELAPAREPAAAPTRAALDLLTELTDEAAVRLRNYLVARHLTQVVAATPPGAAAPAEAVALLLANPGALPEMLAVAGPLLRHVPGPRSLALPLFDAAQQRSPLNDALRHFLAREWFTGTRWASLPAIESAGALPTELLTPPLSPLTCAEARDDGARAYAPLGEQEVTLQVSPSLAPPPALRRFSLVALRRGEPRLGWAELLLDGEATRLPLVLQSEPIPLALAAGRHTLRAVLGSQQIGALLGPCELRDSEDPALLVEHHFSAMVGRGAQVLVTAPEPGTPAFFGLELRASPELHGGRLLLRTEQGVLGRIELDGHGLDPVAGGRALGPAVAVALPLPASAQSIEIIREDDGAPLLLRALLRRSLAKQSKPAARLPVVERTPQQLELLRQATRSLRKAQDDKARARARLERAELLIGLNSLTLARHDLDRGLPVIKDASTLSQARELLTSATELPLLVRQPSGRAAVILAAGANLEATAAETACVTAALTRFAVAPEAGLQASAGCSGLVGLYAAARLEEQSGNPLRAAQHYEQAYLQALERGLTRPALARQAARQYAERGPGPGSKHGLALATAAVQQDDPEGARALGLVRGLTHSQTVRGVDAGESVRLPEGDIPPLSLHAALADVPWPAGMFLEARAGRTTETDLQVKHPLRVRVDALCDDQGEPVPEVPACNLRLAIDGTPVDSAPRVLSAGQRARLAEVALEPGAHRIQITLARQQALAYFHFSTSRPLSGAVGEADADGFYAMPITAPPVLRFTGSPAEPVQLRLQGPTVLRIDALAARAAGERALRVELIREDHTRSERAYPLCKTEAEQPIPATQPGYNCRSPVAVPLVYPGTYQVKIIPVGTPSVALALAIYDDEPAGGLSGGEDNSRVATAEPDARRLPAAANPALQALKAPDSNFLRGLGTLQAQQLGIFGSAGRSDPQIGDTFAETAILYRRKLEGLPIWLRAGGYLRLREGPSSFGLEGTAFGRIPVAELRVYADLQGFTQLVEGHQEYALGLRSYLERSFQLIPHLFLLPRFAFTASYQSLAARPKLTASDAAPTPVDLLVFNQFDAAHPTGIYGQLLLWWVPFINLLSYTELRLSSNRDVHQLDGVRARVGVDMAFHTTEIVLDYQLDHFLVDDARNTAIQWHTFSGVVNQTIWLNRNHRLGLTLSANVEVLSQATTFVFGAFWEGSRGRGLDDYATPEINLPQQLSRGRGYQRPEETYR